ncbi:MAG: MinD/ParA family protein [Planctomycetes bacterium]|jgi:flagellar biosynthesis protein FlhG|nr:MinD/ParA family protein [Planctomycetota bacterium]
MENPALNLHAVADDGRPMATVLAIASGKGGVGKTNIAANLAVCLAAANQRVLLLDADLSLGNLDLLMNLHSKYNISHVLSGRKSMEEIIQTGPQGVRVVCGASGLERLADISEGEHCRLIQHLGRLQRETDTILIDTAAGISRSVIGFCLAADGVLVVTTPEATAMADSYGMIKVLARKGYAGPINLVVNMACSLAEGKQTYQRMADVAQRFLQTTVYYAGTLLKDERLCAAVRSRTPVVLAYPKSQISESLAAVATRLGGTRRPVGPDDSFFRRVIRWLN